MPNDERDNPSIRVPPPPIYVLALLLALVLDRNVTRPLTRPLLAARGGARPRLAACGRRDGARGVVRSDDARRRHYAIRIDKPVSSLVQNGPFRYSRNPGYVALAMIYAGIAVLRNALWAMLLLPLVVYVIQREVIEREERYLERTFGEEYLAYKARVRRWV